MSVRHSHENLSDALQQQDPFYGSRHEPLNSQELTAVSPCKHKFHNRRILRSLENNRRYPVCKNPCTIRQLSLSNNNVAAELDAAEQAPELLNLGLNDNQGNVNTSIGNRSVGRNRRGATPRRGMSTRSTNRNSQNQHCTINNSNARKPLHAVPHQTTSTVHFDSLLQNALQNQQQQIMKNVTALKQNQLANIHIQKEQQISPPLIASIDLLRNFNMNQTQNDSSNRSLNNSTLIPPEKVSNIIQNWHIKFDGSC